ncbi:hypothetical protein D782_2490 [Enterobacteriaceae bacterium strain FGI 57]|jgi:hypothetical protein|nr:hypothetical protein D782_2490 [Enterobacteriaceae bacterium strain FGI 57]
MFTSRTLKEAIESIKEFRNDAQAVADAHIDLLSAIVDQAVELSKIPDNERTSEQNAVLDFYYTLAEKVDVSIGAADRYNKSLSKYVQGFKTLNNIASSKNENN